MLYYLWGNNEKRATMKGRPCRILVRSQRMGSLLIEFLDNGQRENVSWRSVGKKRTNHVKTESESKQGTLFQTS